MSERAKAREAALGRAPFDLLLVGGTVVDVATGELRAADIGVVGGLIASVHPRGARGDAAEVHDVSGRWLCPGFIDSHLHFESSLMAPVDYASSVVPHGTTTAVWDPHEIANVCGVAGVRWAVEASRGLPLRVLVAAPSCVPSAPGLELAGAEIGPGEMAEMLAWPEVVSVAEVMDMAGVLAGSASMSGIVAAGLASGKLVQGHARGLHGAELQGYMAAGVTSDHEIISGEDAVEKLRAGMVVELRGSHDDVLPGAIAAIAALPLLPPGLVLCTDDIMPDELLAKGGMRDAMRRMIAHGLSAVQAITCATYHAALRLKRDDIGLLGPGRAAEIVVLRALDTVDVERVYVGGRLVAKGGRMLEALPRELSAAPRGTMKLAPLAADAFRLRVKGVADGEAVLPVVGEPRFTVWRSVRVVVRNGVAAVPEGHALAAVVHRHGRAAPVPQLVLMDGWGEPRGAVATTVAHDSHNLLVLGRDAEDMVAAANALIGCGGGMAVAQRGAVTALLPLPIAGLLAETPAEETARAFGALRAAADAVIDWQLPHRTFPRLTGMALACNPGPRPTDMGIADVALGRAIDPAEPVAA